MICGSVRFKQETDIFLLLFRSTLK